MVESVTCRLLRDFPAERLAAHNSPLDRCTQHIVASAQMCLARSVQQGLANKATRKVEHVTTRHDSPRVVTSNRRNETLAVLARAPQ